MSPRNAPLFVKVGLFGVGSRSSAMLYLLFCVVVAFGGVWYFGNPFSLVMLFAALWYWRAIQWMDQHNGWR